MCCEKYLKDNEDNGLHFAQKYDQILVLGHYLFLKAHSFSGATLLENCSHLGTDHVHGEISKHFAHQMEVIVYIIVSSYILNLNQATRILLLVRAINFFVFLGKK